jgi:hypothetical protein
MNLKLGAINLKFDNLQESLQLYQHEINDAQGLLLTSQRQSDRIKTANSCTIRRQPLINEADHG